MKNSWLRCLVVLVLTFLCLSSAVPVLALSEEDKHAIDLDSVWHKTYKPPTGDCSTGGVKPGPLYFLGDSIGTQVSAGLSSKLNGQGWTVQSNAVSGRTLPEGLNAISQDADFIKTTTAVVVELGTNAGGFTSDTVNQLIDKVHGLAPDAKIFWVDTAVVERQDYARTLSNINSIIAEMAGQKGFQVISWNKKVFGDSADPKNINASAPDNGYIRHADQFVHLTDSGASAMTDLITTTLSGSASTDEATVDCSCTVLIGGDNPEKVWNYLTKNMGLTAVQAAGAMGNIQAESGFNPEALNGIGAYGIIQWLGGRKAGLENLATERKIDKSDLGLQLDFMRQELEGGYRQSVLEPIRATADIVVATRTWLEHYEVPCNPGSAACDTEMNTRLPFAQGWLAKFGSGSSGAGGAGC